MPVTADQSPSTNGLESGEQPQIQSLNEIQTVVDRPDYYRLCDEYALATGWIKPEELPVLEEKYLKPIFDEYDDTLKTVRETLPDLADEDARITRIIHRLNTLLEATRRIGSTDPANIVRGISDSARGWKTSLRGYDDVSDYATDALIEKIKVVLGFL